MTAPRKITLEFPSLRAFLSQYADRISAEGMLLQTDSPPDAGSEVDVEVVLGDGLPLLRARGETLWRGWTGAGRQEYGAAIRFHELDEASRTLIAKVVEQRRREGEPEFELSEVPPPRGSRLRDLTVPAAEAFSEVAAPGAPAGDAVFDLTEPAATAQKPAPPFELEPPIEAGELEAMAREPEAAEPSEPAPEPAPEEPGSAAPAAAEEPWQTGARGEADELFGGPAPAAGDPPVEPPGPDREPTEAANAAEEPLLEVAAGDSDLSALFGGDEPRSPPRGGLTDPFPPSFVDEVEAELQAADRVEAVDSSYTALEADDLRVPAASAEDSDELTLEAPEPIPEPALEPPAMPPLAEAPEAGPPVPEPEAPVIGPPASEPSMIEAPSSGAPEPSLPGGVAPEPAAPDPDHPAPDRPAPQTPTPDIAAPDITAHEIAELEVPELGAPPSGAPAPELTEPEPPPIEAAAEAGPTVPPIADAPPPAPPEPAAPSGEFRALDALAGEPPEPEPEAPRAAPPVGGGGLLPGLDSGRGAETVELPLPEAPFGVRPEVAEAPPPAVTGELEMPPAVTAAAAAAESPELGGPAAPSAVALRGAASRSRHLGTWLLIGLLAAALAIAGYFALGLFWRAAPSGERTAGGALEPATQPAEPEITPAPPAPAAAEPTEPPEAESAPEGAVGEPPAAPEAAAAEPATPEPAPPAAEPAEPQPPAPAAPWSGLDQITWRESDGETLVTLVADGELPSGDAIESLRINAGDPRLVLKLPGAQRAFRPATLEVGTGQVRRIRTGLHPGGLLHVVVDLADPAVAAKSLETRGSRLLLRLGPQGG